MTNAGNRDSIIDREQLIRVIKGDSSIGDEEKSGLLKALGDNVFFGSLVGSAAGNAVAKFLKLSKKSQVLMILAGFGLSKAIQAHKNRQTKNTATFDKKTKTYEVQF